MNAHFRLCDYFGSMQVVFFKVLILTCLIYEPSNALVKVDSSVGATVGTVSSLVNVFPDTPPRLEDMQDKIIIKSAKRESESAQIVITATQSSITIDDVNVYALKCSENESQISPDALKIELVGYVNVEAKPWRGVSRLGRWPDPLLDFRPFVCPIGESRSLWVTVKVPYDSKAGNYKGIIDLFSNKKCIVSVPVEVQVWDFAIPQVPTLSTSYWNRFSCRYDADKEYDIFCDMLKLFGDYRTSTNFWVSSAAKWYLEEDGTVSCDLGGMKKNIEKALEANFATLNVGTGEDGCWGLAALNNPKLIERTTGQEVKDNDRLAKINTDLATKLYLSGICDFLGQKNVLNRAYIQIYDEMFDPTKWPSSIESPYKRIRRIEPRIKLLGLIGIHPELQGLFDIWSPYQSLYDHQIYDMVSKGVSLYGPKNFPATVTSSSSGGQEAVEYKYRPVDAYDGSDYTRWDSGELPTKDKPQWLLFNFKATETIDGIRIVPLGFNEQERYWRFEVSNDGKIFNEVVLNQVDNLSWTFSFKKIKCKAARFIWYGGSRPFVSGEDQPMPPPEFFDTPGIREVEFLCKGIPSEGTLKRGIVRPSEMWEYQIGASYPISVCIPAESSEIRATGWQCWNRNLKGYLNYGAGQWDMEQCDRPKSIDPMEWPALKFDNGSGMIVYPGAKRVLPSIRLARFRDGIDDFDYLSILSQYNAKHPLLSSFRSKGYLAYSTSECITKNRDKLAEAIQSIDEH